jgi:hypothetical protein
MALALGLGCGRPITVHALMQGSTVPVEDVRIYKYRFSIFSIFPSKKSVQTDSQGQARVDVGPNATNLTMLCQGFEPVLLAVFERSTLALSPDEGGYNYVLAFDSLKDKQIVPVEFRPVRSFPLELSVTDRDTGAPIAGAEVLARTFLYLPQPGVEKDWGFPPVQQATTDGAGLASVAQMSGFRNRVTVRLAGYEDAVIDIDGRAELSAHARQVSMRALNVKHIRFQLIDVQTRQPITNAEVSFGATRDGLPPSPEAWTKPVDASGSTGLMPVPDVTPCLITVKAKGYHDWRGAPMWRALEDGKVKRLELKKK